MPAILKLRKPVGVMKPMLETQRVTLIPFTLLDLTLLHKTFTDPFIRKYLWDDEIISLEQTKKILDLNENTFREQNWGLWKIITKEDDAYAGFAGLWKFFEEDQPQLLFGLLPMKTRSGYASESGSAIINYAFDVLSFKRLTASFDSDNSASEKVCRRLNMTKVEDREMNGRMTTFYKIERN
jgi:[ribosomal protein S5]-alanine N-acetyltransferase